MLKAFMIFDKYDAAENKVDAEHDEVWAGPDPKVVSEEDLAALAELGWYPSEESFHHFV